MYRLFYFRAVGGGGDMRTQSQCSGVWGPRAPGCGRGILGSVAHCPLSLHRRACYCPGSCVETEHIHTLNCVTSNIICTCVHEIYVGMPCHKHRKRQKAGVEMEILNTQRTHARLLRGALSPLPRRQLDSVPENPRPSRVPRSDRNKRPTQTLSSESAV